MVVPDHALPHISFRTPSHGTGTSGAGSSTGSMAGENPTTLHPAMHLSTITPPQPVEPHEMMTPDPNARYIHGDQVHQDCIPKENMVFATEEEGYAFYMQYARAAGFGSKKHKNKAMSRVYACSRQGSSEFYKEAEKRKRGKMSKRIGCMASVKLKLRGKEWFYERVELEHNHTLNPDPCEVKHMRSHKNKHPVMMDYVDGLQHSGVSPNATVNVLTELHGDYGHMLMNARDLENRRAANLRKEQVDDVKKLVTFFNECRAQNPKFYSDIDYDSEGVVKNIFWSHASCQANYAEFKDVVTFDTTYRSNFYRMPLGMFVGSNHHLQNVIFGFALVGDETEETFEWVFRTFQRCMEGKDPICILTDQDQAMANAIRRVFLETIHRLCRWHMLNKHTVELNKLYYLHKGLEEKLLTAVNHPLTPLEFENAWKEMVTEHGLQNDPTLRGLYEHRASWIAAYFKGIFCGTMTSTQRSESTNRMVKRYHVDKSTPLHMFARRMYQMLQRRKDDEGLETVYSQDPPDTKTNYHLEHQLGRIYTRAVFKKYQDAYFAATSFRTKNCSQHLSIPI
ncbi:hypothetical protein ACQ4PT_039995 [Festuca glaucescens]